MRLGFQILASHIGQFVRVLARSRYTYSAGPVVIHVRQFVGEFLEDIYPPLTLVMAKNDVVGGRDSSLTHVLRYQEEILPVKQDKTDGLGRHHSYIQDGIIVHTMAAIGANDRKLQQAHTRNIDDG